MSPADTDEGSADRLRSLVERVVARVGGLRATRTLVGVLEAYDRAGGGLTASGLAYTSLIALLPGLLLMVSIFGIVIEDEATREQVVSAIAKAVPPLEEFARAAFESVSAGAVPTGIIAVLGLLWGSSRFYAALDYAFARIFQDGRRRNEIERTLRGVVVTFLLVAVPLGALVLGIIAGWLSEVMPGDIAGLILQLVSPVGSFLLFVIGTMLVYRYVPGKHVPWRALVLPALLVGVTLAGFAQLYAIFAPLLTKMAAIYGTFVAFFAILAWLAISFNLAAVRGVLDACPRAGTAGARSGDGRRREGSAGGDDASRAVIQAWRVPQRRQNRALGESERPQLTHGWGVAGTAAAGVTGFDPPARTSRAEAAHRAAALSWGTIGRPARVVGSSRDVPDRVHCGAIGHCGAVEPSSGATVSHGFEGAVGSASG